MFLSISLFFHPLHITLLSINQAEGSDRMTLFFRIYFDDFQDDYALIHPGYRSVTDFKSSGITNELLEDYFNRRVKIYVNRKLVPASILDVDVDHYEMRLNLSCVTGKEIRSLKISNEALVKIYDDQSNMVYLNISGYENAIKLTTAQSVETIKLK